MRFLINVVVLAIISTLIGFAIAHLIIKSAIAQEAPASGHYAMVLVIDMPDAKTCGDAIMDYVGQGDVYCIEAPTLAPETSPKPRPRPVRQ